VTRPRPRPFARVALSALFAALPTAAPIADAADAPAPTELKLSVAVGPAFALGSAADRWAKCIAAKSGSRLPVKVFAGATLAQRNPAREFAALKDGTADLAVGSSLQWSTDVKELGVVALPWLAAGPPRLAALLTGTVAEALAAGVARAGVVQVAIAPLGHHALATTEREVKTPADLAGLRVRVVGPPAISEFYQALGALPQSITFAAAEAALAAGTLDAQDGSAPVFAAAHVDAIGLKRVLLWNALAEAAVFAVNRARWETWSEGDRGLVRDCAREVAGDVAGIAQQGEDAAIKDLRRGGMSFARLTPAGRTAFVAATRALHDQWAAVIGADLVHAAETAVDAVPP
jgi:TRAP-type transport system periplasmic protein